MKLPRGELLKAMDFVQSPRICGQYIYILAPVLLRNEIWSSSSQPFRARKIQQMTEGIVAGW